MNPNTLSIRDLFDAAVALDAGARNAYLDRHCADPQQRARVEALLAADADADEPLEGDGIERIAEAM